MMFAAAVVTDCNFHPVRPSFRPPLLVYSEDPPLSLTRPSLRTLVSSFFISGLLPASSPSQLQSQEHSKRRD